MSENYTDMYDLSDLLDSYADEENARRLCICGHTFGVHDESEKPCPCDVEDCGCMEFVEVTK